MTTAVNQLAAVAVIMLVLDAGWLTANAAFHRQVFAAMQGQPLQIRILPTIAVYALMIWAVWFFAVQGTQTWKEAAARGAGIGLAMYGLYDLTNYATLVKYPVDYALKDIAWGTVLCAVTAAAAKALVG